VRTRLIASAFAELMLDDCGQPGPHKSALQFICHRGTCSNQESGPFRKTEECRYIINAVLILAIIQKLHIKWCNKILEDYTRIRRDSRRIDEPNQRAAFEAGRVSQSRCCRGALASYCLAAHLPSNSWPSENIRDSASCIQSRRVCDSSVHVITAKGG
jgi:hypothetical protein